MNQAVIPWHVSGWTVPVGGFTESGKRIVMNTKLHVDNLAAATTENDLRDLFSAHGTVAEVNVPTDGATGRSRGFGFVTMVTPEGARSARQALNGKSIGSCTLTVSDAWPHEQRGASSRGR
jgi:RNA recognition motif-containing protein